MSQFQPYQGRNFNHFLPLRGMGRDENYAETQPRGVMLKIMRALPIIPFFNRNFFSGPREEPGPGVGTAARYSYTLSRAGGQLIQPVK